MLIYLRSFLKNRLMDRNKLHQDIQTLVLALILFTFPFRPLLLNNICVILLGVNWMVHGNLKLKFNTLVRSKIALLYLGLYIVLIISYFFSENRRHAGFVLEKNLLILILPLILSTAGVNRTQMIKALYAFVAGCLLAIIICLIMATYKYNLTHQTHYFFYHDLSENIRLHAVYFSLYLAFCILFLVQQLNIGWKNLTWNSRALYIGIILIFCCFIILLTSKTIIIGLTLSLNLLFIIWIVKRNKVLAGILAILIINVSILIGIIKIDYVKSRFLDSINSNIEFIKKDTYSELTVFTGVTVRITFWKFVIEVLSENNSWWTGMTIGDADNALHNKAVEKKLFGGNEERGWTDYTSYNAHNQYFQYLLLMGVAGLVYFMIILISILVHALNHKDQLLLLSTLLFMLFCFTESVLEVNKGIIFFSVIPPLLIYADGISNNLSVKSA